MGYNTTVVIMNDALENIKNDKEFGAKLVAAINHLQIDNKPIDVSATSGNITNVNAATVIESHHADDIVVVSVGGNYGKVLGFGGNYDATKEQMLESLASSMGYRLVKKTSKKLDYAEEAILGTLPK